MENFSENSLEANFKNFYDWKVDLYQFIKNDKFLNEMFYDSFDKIRDKRQIDEEIIITKKISKNDRIKMVIYRDSDLDLDLDLDLDILKDINKDKDKDQDIEESC